MIVESAIQKFRRQKEEIQRINPSFCLIYGNPFGKPGFNVVDSQGQPAEVGLSCEDVDEYICHEKMKQIVKSVSALVYSQD